MTKDEINNLIIENSNICYHISWQYYRKCSTILDFDDIVGICNLGLVKAANTYDSDKGYAFSTYAYKVINNEMLMYLRDNKRRNKYNINFISINDSMDFDETLSLEDLISDNYDLEQEVEDKMLIDLLHTFINELPDMLRGAILYKLEGKTQQEIARLLNVSQPQVSRLLSKATYRLRLKFRREGML